MKIYCIAFLFLVGCQSVNWSKTDSAWHGAVVTSLAADYMQTRSAIDDGFTEHNPVMGTSGDRMSPELYFPGVAVLVTGTAVALPTKWRRVLQVAVILVQSHTIYGNLSEGAGFGWTW